MSSDGVELTIETYGGRLADGFLEVRVEGHGTGSISLKALKAALDWISLPEPPEAPND